MGKVGKSRDLLVTAAKFVGKLNGFSIRCDNNKRVWLMLRTVTHKTDAWQTIKGFARAQNGRQEYLSFIAHFKGRGHISRIKTDARNVLERIFWKGNSRSFTFDTFVSRLRGPYHDLAEYGDDRTNESKVDTLLTKVSGDSSCRHVPL